MKEQLELKHLAPYLPYGLKVTHITYSECGRHKNIIVDVESLHKECITFSDGMDYYFEDPQDNECSIKPILRPLSDLTKEIEHNGERFVPVIEFGFPNTDEVKESFLSVIRHLHVPYCEFVKLLEWHFDIFGLIDKGLAIDNNTLAHA